jgi:hypothetical protein
MFDLSRVQVPNHPLHKFLSVRSLATVKSGQTLVNARTKLFEMHGAEAIVLFEEAQSFPNHFAGGIVTPTPNLGLDQFFEFRG